MSSQATPRIYLAGPDVFLPDPLGFAERKKALCSEAGLEGVFPLDAGLNLDEIPSSPDEADALIDGDAKLWDSGTICLYLTDKHPEKNLGAAIDDPQRANYIQWVMFSSSVIEPAMVEKFAKIEPNASQHGHGSFEKLIAVLKAGLKGGQWLLGDRFTAADVLCGSGARFMHLFGILGDEPELKACIERCEARPAFQRAAALEND